MVQETRSQEICLVFPGTPKAVQSFKFAHVGKFIRKYQPTKTVDWKIYLKVLALQQLPDGFVMYDNMALGIIVNFVFKLPKSASKKEKLMVENGDILPHQKRPDLTDNLMKGLCDAMTGTIWSDDSKVSCVGSLKFYGEVPRIIIQVKPFEVIKELLLIQLPDGERICQHTKDMIPIVTTALPQ